MPYILSKEEQKQTDEQEHAKCDQQYVSSLGQAGAAPLQLVSLFAHLKIRL
jgi:hypothetical protein